MSISESRILPDLFLACMGGSAIEITRTLTEMQLVLHHDSASALHTWGCLSRYSNQKKKKTPTVVSQSHYNSVLSLAEYFLFQKLIVLQDISLNQ